MAKLTWEAQIGTVQPVTNLYKVISAHGSTRSNAVLLLQKKLAAMVTSLVGGTGRVKNDLVPAVVAADYLLHAATQFEDAVIILNQITNGVVTDSALVKIKNMSTAYAGTLPGVIDVSLADIQDMASNHADSAGNKGFIPVAGHYVD